MTNAAHDITKILERLHVEIEKTCEQQAGSVSVLNRTVPMVADYGKLSFLCEEFERGLEAFVFAAKAEDWSPEAITDQLLRWGYGYTTKGAVASRTYGYRWSDPDAEAAE